MKTTEEQKKARFTPGPWHTRSKDMVYAGSGRMVADCELTPYGDRPAPPSREDEANAQLIAAAPELLEALEALESDLSDEGKAHAVDIWNERKGMIRAAIAKANGLQ